VATGVSEKRRYTRSPSQLKSVTRCGEAFRVSRLVKPRPPARPVAWTILGIAVHDAVMQWEKNDRNADLDVYFQQAWDVAVEEAWRRQPNEKLWMLPPGTKSVKASLENYRRRGMERDIPNYERRCHEAEWEILRLPNGEKALELSFEVDLEGVTVKGQIDRILFYPDSGVVAKEDLKTGSPDDADDVRQLGIYRIGAMECYDIPLTHGRYWYTKLDRPGDWVDLTRYTRKYLAGEYGILDRMIDGGLLLPNPGKVCGLCDVRPWCREMGWLKPGESL
jgi:putative RecB family exonuclease